MTNKNNQNRQQPAGQGNNQAGAGASANQGGASDAAQVSASSKPPAPKWAIGDVVDLVPVFGPVRHLHTDELFGAEPKAAEIDAFIALQLEAGKLAIHSES